MRASYFPGEAVADPLGEESKGYMVHTSGGNRKQGLPLGGPSKVSGPTAKCTCCCVTLVRDQGKLERGSPSLSANTLDASLSPQLGYRKQRLKEIPGLTKTAVPQRLGPKRTAESESFQSF